MEGNFFNADFGYALTLDERNQAYKPTQGHKITFRQSLPIIQDSSSIMNGLDISSYHDFSEDLIGSFKIYGRSIHGIDEDVRLTNIVYNVPCNTTNLHIHSHMQICTFNTRSPNTIIILLIKF